MIQRFFSRKSIAMLLVGTTLGILIVLGTRFFTYHENHVHYHANFAVYINGKREEFKSPFYYEEIAACNTDEAMSPKQRVHMHDNKNDVVHVHDKAVTWGNFLQNIGWSVDQDYLKTNEKLYVSDDINKVTFVLNGKTIRDVSQLPIESRDRLLINYGDTDAATLKKEADSISSSANHYNTTKDPASCSGDQAPTIKKRLQHLW